MLACERRIDERDRPIVDVALQELDAPAAVGEDEVVRECFVVVQEVVLDRLGLVAQAHDEVVVSPFTLSSAASHSIEEIAEAMGGAPRWFQLYWVERREICSSLVKRAEAAGYAAMVVALDALTLGWRPRDLRNAYLPFLAGEGCAQFLQRPIFCSRLDKSPAEDTLGAAATMLATFPNLGLTGAISPGYANRPRCRCS